MRRACIGDTGYDHETGKIVNEKQRAIFERLHPNFEEEQLRKKEKILKKQTKNYNLVIDEKYIKLELKNERSIDYFTYNKDFLNILNTWRVTPYYKEGRLQADYRRSPRTPKKKIYLYDLAYACYLGIAHAETLEADLQKYFAWKNQQGPTVDHLDGNPHNNTFLNLSPMSISTNSSKEMFPAGFIPPYTLTMAYVDGEYRVRFTLVNERDFMQQLLDSVFPGMFTIENGGIGGLCFRCADAETLISCLKHFYKTKFEWCNPGGTAKGHKKEHREINHLTADIERSLVAQEALAQMDRSEFQIFVPGE